MRKKLTETSSCYQRILLWIFVALWRKFCWYFVFDIFEVYLLWLSVQHLNVLFSQVFTLKVQWEKNLRKQVHAINGFCYGFLLLCDENSVDILFLIYLKYICCDF